MNVRFAYVIKTSQAIIPYTLAAMLLTVFFVVTNEHGLGLSTDSVSYLGAAHSLLTTGILQVPLTVWNSETQYAPLTHFPPILPVLLSVLSWSLDTTPVWAGRWLNGVCIFSTSLALLFPMTKSLRDIPVSSPAGFAGTRTPDHLVRRLDSELQLVVFIVTLAGAFVANCLALHHRAGLHPAKLRHAYKRRRSGRVPLPYSYNRVSETYATFYSRG